MTRTLRAIGRLLRGLLVVALTVLAVVFLGTAAQAEPPPGSRYEMEDSECSGGTLSPPATGVSGGRFRTSAGPADRIICFIQMPAHAGLFVNVDDSGTSYTVRLANTQTDYVRTTRTTFLTDSGPVPLRWTVELYKTVAGPVGSGAYALFDYLDVVMPLCDSWAGLTPVPSPGVGCQLAVKQGGGSWPVTLPTPVPVLVGGSVQLNTASPLPVSVVGGGGTLSCVEPYPGFASPTPSPTASPAASPYPGPRGCAVVATLAESQALPLWLFLGLLAFVALFTLVRREGRALRV